MIVMVHAVYVATQLHTAELSPRIDIPLGAEGACVVSYSRGRVVTTRPRNELVNDSTRVSWWMWRR